LNRRRFLAASIAAAGAACVSPAGFDAGRTRLPAIAGGRTVPLAAVRRIVVERSDPVLGRCHYVAVAGAEKIARPLLLARRGDRFDAVIENRLPQPTTIHFHGFTLSEAQDGAGFDPIPPGASRTLTFRVRNPSGLYWFHPHPHGFTAEQVYSGLFGLIVVGDDDDRALDEALALAPVNRLALAVSDARIIGGTIRPYAPGADECHFGWLGNRAMANGALDARYSVAPGWVRIQLLNACNARGLLLAFRDGAHAIPFHLLGTDGGLLRAPVALDRVFLHPAERVDLAVETGTDRAVEAVSLEFDPRLHAPGHAHAHRHPERERYPALVQADICGSSAIGAGDFVPEGARFPLFWLAVTGTGGPKPPLPESLCALSEAAAAPGAALRRIRLDFDERRGFLIDGEPYDVAQIAFRVPRGAREVWEVKNSPISMPHPMHLHGFGFRVLRRQGTFGPARALANAGAGRVPTDLGVKDTVLVWPNETVQLAVDFSLPDDPAFRGPQRYMFHCHNLEHEDAMMMQNFAVA
jgi:suppressor of ftsI/bilirubin oxidase